MSPSVSIRLLLTQSDARLAEFAQAGHERAFEALVRRYRRPLLGYCRRLLLSEERAEDALQQALLQAWLALRAGTAVGDVKPWLYRIVHNTALNVLRVSGYDYAQLSESLSGADAPQEDLDRRIAVREALAGLAALPPMQREALLRTAVEGRSHQQVARDLGLSEPALRGLVYRARATLRAAAGVIVPPPLLTWALGSGARGTPIVERLAELGATGGSAGMAGLLVKGGAVAVTATVLAGGIAAVHVHPRDSHRHSTSHPTHRLAPQPESVQVALADARAASVAPSPRGGHALSRRRLPPANRPASARHSQSPRQTNTMPFTTKIVIPPPGTTSASLGGDGHQRGRGEGGDAANQGQGTESSGPQSGTNAVSGGDARHSEDSSQHGGTAQQGSDGGSGGEEARGAGSTEGGTQSGDTRDGSGPTGGDGSSTGTNQSNESPQHQDSSSSSGSSSMLGTSDSSKDKEEQDSLSEVKQPN